ncbi:MAG TPA: thiamine-phosphate kinase [Actinomycetota bacterium]
MELTEDALIAAIRRVVSGAADRVVVGPGDDAAVVSPGTGELVLTTDALVEDVHFRRDLTTPRDLGYKSIAVNVSDVAAMAASPRFALCALTVSDAVDAAWVVELAAGMRECCDEFALSLVGGNVARGRDVTIAVTVTGEVAPGRAVRRDGARPGDALVVTGSVGGAAAGMRLASRRSWTDDERDALRRQGRPTPRVGEGGVLAAHGATAMIDVSDGLSLDLSRLCAASGVGARVELARVPAHPAATLDEALGGGEDYELLATMPDDAAVSAARAQLRESFGVPLAAIGRIIEEGLFAVDEDGRERELEPRGWDHLR